MWRQRILGIIVLGCILQKSQVTGLWSCDQDVECNGLSGGICRNGDCVCPPGKNAVLGGSVCVDHAPYYISPCIEDHQCSRLSVAFQCRRNSADDQTGNCFCQPGHHYFLGRCWRSVEHGSPCSRSEECMFTIRDPFSMTCEGTCQCSEGYYLRQRGECRKIAFAVGDGCVLDADCQFEGGACDITNFVCYDSNAPPPETPEARSSKPETVAVTNVTATSNAISRQYAEECDVNNPCPEPYVCSDESFGVCICPIGYYASEDGSICYAQLGSPSTEEQCIGFLAVVADGVCTCPPNFFFEENMRDCTKVSRQITDSCVTDASCHTFGAASVCGAEQPPWFLRNCECVPEVAVWDSSLQMCRLFVGIGEQCDTDTDCLAGSLQIQCVADEEGQGYCTCPEGLVAVDGLCLTSGLVLGDACQVTQECTGTPNTICEDSKCTCDSSGYQEVDGVCLPIIGGVCEQDSDCVIENTLCTHTNGSDGLTCQCDEEFVVYGEACWPKISSETAPCNVSAQCQQLLGKESLCSDNKCVCEPSFHRRDGGCWPITGLMEPCSRSSQCFLSEDAERAVCRNSLCQCEFNFPYDEELHTCTSSASPALASVVLLAVRLALTRVVL